MELVKKVFSNIDFHLNTAKRTLTILYGNSSIMLQITEDGKVKLATDLTVEGLLTESKKSNVTS